MVSRTWGRRRHIPACVGECPPSLQHLCGLTRAHWTADGWSLSTILVGGGVHGPSEHRGTRNGHLGMDPEWKPDGIRAGSRRPRDSHSRKSICFVIS